MGGVEKMNQYFADLHIHLGGSSEGTPVKITASRKLTFDAVINECVNRKGIDIAGLGYGKPIYAANNGTIWATKYQPGYGYHVIINHNNGYYTLYAHMKAFAPNITSGKTVSRGQVIGYIGSTGMSTGPHVHFEIWNAPYQRISPWTFYKR